MTHAGMRVRVLLFASYADWLGTDSLDLSMEPHATVADVVERLRAGTPGGSRIPQRPLAAVNQTHARLDAPVHEGDEIALLPPLAGG